MSYSPVKVLQDIDNSALKALYNSVGWTGYTEDISVLRKAIEGSSHVVVVEEDGQIIGLAHALSDDATMMYIQDILVHPTHQSKGIGKALVNALLERYKHVRQKVVLTDDRPQQMQFYAALGFKNTRELVKTPLNAFVIIEGTTLANKVLSTRMKLCIPKTKTRPSKPCL